MHVIVYRYLLAPNIWMPDAKIGASEKVKVGNDASNEYNFQF